MTMKQYIIAFLAIIGLAAGGYAALQHQQGEFSVGGDLVTPIAGQTYTLAGSGISSAETSFTLTSFTITQTGYRIQDSDMSDVFYVTFEPGSRSRQEIASCTTVMQNADGTATISGCTRGLLPISPYTASTSLQFAHGGGSTVIFSDPPQLFNQAGFKDNDETITGSWLFPAPLSDSNAATKAYVDALVTGGTVSNDRLVVAGTAGETLATGTLVYLNPSTQRWNGVSTASTTTFDDRFIGLTQGAGTNGVAVNGGVLLKGRHTLSTGLTPGAVYYGATATGTISTATSAQPVGIAVSSNVLYFDPVLIDVPHEMANNTFTGTNTFTGAAVFSSLITGHASTVVRVYTTTGTSTWTKPDNIEYISLWVCAGGGGGGGGTAAGVSGAGGGGGGCAFEILDSTELAATSSIIVTVATGGTAGAGTGGTGGTGGTSSLGTFVSCTGGTGGSGTQTNAGGTGGTCTGGDLNLTGNAGGGDEADGASGGHGGGSFFGGGGVGGNNEASGGAGQNYGGGGGGHANRVGGAGADQAGGVGGQGVVMITEYY